MTRLLQILLLVLLANSCKPYEKKETIDELLIFGYSGFCLKDSVNQIYPSDEIFHNDSIRLEFDSTRLDIRQYFEFKKDSFINSAIRRPRQATEYLSLNQSDTIGFQKLINLSLINKRYEINYRFNDSIPMMYDGWFYTLYYKTSKNNRFMLSYIPEYLPDSLRILHEFVENILVKNQNKKTNKFEYNPITSTEAKRLFRKYPPSLPVKLDIKVQYKEPLKKEKRNN